MDKDGDCDEKVGHQLKQHQAADLCSAQSHHQPRAWSPACKPLQQKHQTQIRDELHTKPQQSAIPHTTQVHTWPALKVMVHEDHKLPQDECA